jgi:hypothetical protein
MAKIASIAVLSLVGLMVSATLAAAQTSSLDPSATESAAKPKGWFSGFRLEPWDNQPAKAAATVDAPVKKKAKIKPAEPASAKLAAATDQTAAKKPGMFSGFRLQPWHEDAKAKPAKAAPTKLAETADRPNKAGLFTGPKLEPWRDSDATAASSEPTTNFSAPGLRLQRWDEKDDPASGK